MDFGYLLGLVCYTSTSHGAACCQHGRPAADSGASGSWKQVPATGNGPRKAVKGLASFQSREWWFQWLWEMNVTKEVTLPTKQQWRLRSSEFKECAVFDVLQCQTAAPTESCPERGQWAKWPKTTYGASPGCDSLLWEDFILSQWSSLCHSGSFNNVMNKPVQN